MAPEQYGDKYQDHLVEQYRLYVEMAEATSRRRDQVNRFYPTLFSALAAILFVVPKLNLPQSSGEFDSIWPWVLVLTGFMGVYLSLTWLITIWSLGRLINAKHRIIREMEGELPFAPYTQETNYPPFASRYQRSVDLFLPMIFIVPFYLLTFLAISSMLEGSW